MDRYSLSCIFSVFEGSPSLLQFLNDFLGQALVFEPPIEILDIERRELFVWNDAGIGII